MIPAIQASEVCSMLLPRYAHGRLRYVLLHTTRTYMRQSRDAFQLDPFTAHVIVDSTPSSPGRSQSKSDGRKTKAIRAGKRRTTKLHEKKLSSDSDELSSSVRLYDGRVPSENAVQPGPSADSLNSCGTDGIIYPRASGDPFLEDVLPPSPQSPVPTLAHGLDRVLFQPGVQWLQDPRSQVYSFTTWLQQITPVKNFAFERLKSFVPSSRDKDLYAVAKREGRKYAGSTSSLSALLSQLYFLISGDKLVNTADLSRCFRYEPRTFTLGQRGPASVVLHYRDGVYLIDSAEGAVPGLANKNILTWQGTLLEKFLTHPPKEFILLTRSVDDPTVVERRPTREAYRYAKSEKFVVRSQLDCFDSRLPGTGVFDIKTRAVMAIRHDLLNFEENSGYQICTPQGLIESFEKEYYDLIRSAFLKYSFQARIGNMDGVFIAYHNTERIFGFQYIPLSEMDARLFGEHASGNAVFEKCMQLLEAVLERATREFPDQSIRLTAEKRDRRSKLRVFIEPAEWDELQGSKPVTQLDVSVKHYIGKSATDGPNAVERSSLPWTVHWSVSTSTRDSIVVRKNLAGARKRGTFPLFLPRGVTSQQMEKFWDELQFNPAAPVKVPFKAELFRPPPRGVKRLRLLARKGRWRLEHSIHKQKGRPKFVLGIPDDSQRVSKLLALAHGPALVQTTTNLSTRLRRLGPKKRPVRSSSMRLAKTSENQDQTTRKAKNPQTAALASGQTTEGITHIHAAAMAKLFAQGTNTKAAGDFIPETKPVHSEEMLSEDQR